MHSDDSPNNIISDGEVSSIVDPLKRKVGASPQSVSRGTLSSKRSRPVAGSVFNLVSYDLDVEEGDSDSVSVDSVSNLSAPSISNYNAEDIDSGTALAFVASDSGPLTVLSSAHIESTHDSPALPHQDMPTANKDQKEKVQISQTVSPTSDSNHVRYFGVTLPPEPTELCSMHLQNTVENTLQRMRHDIRFDPNRVIQDNKAFRNPSIYKKLISYLNIDENGTNFSPDVFNPNQWDTNSFYNKLAEIQNREVERLEKLQKERRRMETSGLGNITSGPPRSINGPSLGTNSTSSTGYNVTSDKLPELKRKSKWDTAASSGHPHLPPQTAAPQMANPTVPKVTIPAVGDLFSKK